VILVEQVFINLLENAVKYTPVGTSIEITASEKNNEMCVSVADAGPGLQPGDEKKIFEKFYRGKSAGAAGGAGLGLAICRAIIEAHGGKIWAETNPGGGAVFRFTLPLKGERPIPEQLPEVQAS
jgi:two-component system sensor histidine kinase KdpD